MKGSEPLELQMLDSRKSAQVVEMPFQPQRQGSYQQEVVAVAVTWAMAKQSRSRSGKRWVSVNLVFSSFLFLPLILLSRVQSGPGRRRESRGFQIVALTGEIEFRSTRSVGVEHEVGGSQE